MTIGCTVPVGTERIGPPGDPRRLPSAGGAPTWTASDDRPPRRFPTWDADTLAELAGYGTERDVAPGDELLHAGRASSGFYVVLDGEIEVVRPDIDRDVPVGVLGPGQFVGGVSLLHRAAALPDRPGHARRGASSTSRPTSSGGSWAPAATWPT